jgi:hypothetical protein
LVRSINTHYGCCLLNDGFWCFRFVLQDPGNVSISVLHKVPRLIHVFHFSLQHPHEVVLHIFNCLHHLPYEEKEDILHSEQQFYFCSNLLKFIDLWRSRRWFPTFYGSIACCFRGHTHYQHWLYFVGVYVELQLVARGSCLYSSNCDAEQDQNNWEHYITLRSLPWSLSILLYSQLVSYV